MSVEVIFVNKMLVGELQLKRSLGILGHRQWTILKYILGK